jgi:hypothetical protein
MNWWREVVGTGAALLFAQATCAAAHVIGCEGRIASVAVSDASGAVRLAYGDYGEVTVCSIAVESNGIAASTCGAWLSSMRAAYAHGKPVRVYFDAAIAGNPDSCSVLQPGDRVTPYFVQSLE